MVSSEIWLDHFSISRKDTHNTRLPSDNTPYTVIVTDDFVCCYQEDDEGHQVVLHIIQDLMKKAQDIFLEHFARLGMFGRVLELAGPQENEAMAINEEKVGHRSLNADQN